MLFNPKTNNLFVKLYVPNLKRKKTFNVHTLVAGAFVPGYNQETDMIKFIDNNRKNCALNNLEVYRYHKIYPMKEG